ncbi:MAG: NAD-dependent epimerase/dehydratase family protein [Verrucomicrobiota bacterium]
MQIADSDILVVGGAGFVGSNLVRLVLEQGVGSVTVVDNLLSSERDNLPDDSRITFVEGSIADDQILAKLKEDGYDFIFHLATYHGNQSSMHDPIADHDNNLITTLKLFEKIKDWKEKLKKLVYSGAGCAVAAKTYGEAQATSEDAPISIEMDSPYSISKIVGEFYCDYYHRQHGVPAVRARFQNVYGPGEVLGAGRWRGTPATVWRNVTPAFIYKSCNGEALPLDGGGKTTRDFIFVKDIVRGLVACALKGAPCEAYNLGTGQERTIGELAGLINEATGNKAGVEMKPRRSWDKSGCRFGDPAKSERELGFKAETSLEEGIPQTVEWFRKNEEKVNRCIAKHADHMGG